MLPFITILVEEVDVGRSEEDDNVSLGSGAACSCSKCLRSRDAKETCQVLGAYGAA